MDELTVCTLELLHLCRKTMWGSDFSDLYGCELTFGAIVVGWCLFQWNNSSVRGVCECACFWNWTLCFLEKSWRVIHFSCRKTKPRNAPGCPALLQHSKFWLICDLAHDSCSLLVFLRFIFSSHQVVKVASLEKSSIPASGVRLWEHLPTAVLASLLNRSLFCFHSLVDFRFD